jgi:cation diffusion facilitator CzcD-associated flavoprotein CzcO
MKLLMYSMMKSPCMVTRFCKPTSLEAQFVVFASGPLHIPQIPHIQGIEKFKGKVFILHNGNMTTV